VLIEVEWIFYGAIPTGFGLFWGGASTFPGIFDFTTFASPVLTSMQMARIHVRRSPLYDNYILSTAMGGQSGGFATSVLLTTIDAWGSPWTLVANHSGVPSGGTIHFKWTVTRTQN
jgi:hypothetical protein